MHTQKHFRKKCRIRGYAFTGTVSTKCIYVSMYKYQVSHAWMHTISFSKQVGLYLHLCGMLRYLSFYRWRSNPPGKLNRLCVFGNLVALDSRRD